MAEDQQVQVVRDLIASLVASWPEGYAGVRAVLEELVEALPVQGPHPARMAARDYIARHCQACGASVSRITDDTVAELGVCSSWPRKCITSVSALKYHLISTVNREPNGRR